MKNRVKRYVSKLIFFKELPERLKKELYIVGGLFPALYYHKPINDIDLIVKDVKKFRRELSKYFKRDFHLISDNRGNEVLKFVFSKTHFDITQILENIEKDAARRDFTINSVYYSFAEDTMLDPLDGMDDIKTKLLRMCSPEFLELDPIRFLRAFRLETFYDLKIESRTQKTINSFSMERLMEMPKERLYYEMKKIFNINPSFNIIEDLEKRGVISSIIKPLSLLERDIEQNKYHSFDIYTHSLLVYKWIEHYEKEYDYYNNSFILKLSGLLHDIGKEKTRTMNEKGEYHFYGHEKVSFLEVEEFLKSEPLSKKEKRLLLSLIKDHMDLAYLKFNNNITNRSLRKFNDRTHGSIMEHIILFLGDGAAAHDKRDRGQEDFVKRFLLKLDEFKRMVNKKKKRILSGEDLMEIGYKSGVALGKMLKKINELYLEGKICSKKEALEYAKKILKNN